MLRSTLAVACVVAVVGAAIAEEPRRELGAHVHGQGFLNVAIEGNRVVMEFRAPGADITGSETKAETAEAKAALATAVAVLEKPLGLFGLPEGAGCKVVTAKVAAIADDDDDDDHAAEAVAGAKSPAPKVDAGKPDPAKAADHDHHHDHSDVQGSYELACATPARMTALQFDYFRAFPRAQKVIVQVITARGQSQFEVTAANPRVELGGLM